MKTIARYTTIFRSAFFVIWKNKFLVFFGLFLGGIWVFYENEFDPISRTSSGNITQDAHSFIEQSLSFIQNNPQSIVFGATTFALITGIFFILETFSLAALIRSVHTISYLRKYVSWKISFHFPKQMFKKILLARLLIFAISLGVILICSLPLFLLLIQAEKSELLSFIAILSAILMMYLLVMIFYTGKYAYIYIAISKLSISSAIESGYSLFIKHDISSIVVFIVLFILRIFFLIIVNSIILLVFGFTYSDTQPLLQTIHIETVPIFQSIVVIFIFILAQSVLETYNHTVWVLFFGEIAKQSEKLDGEQGEQFEQKDLIKRKTLPEAQTTDISDVH